MAPKQNAYSVFVNDVFHQKRRLGENVERSSLFQKLSSEWQSLSEEKRQFYKDRAKSAPRNAPLFNMMEKVRTEASNPAAIKQELKPDVEDKKKVELAVSLKRPHEDSLVDDRPKEKKPKPGIPNWKNIKHLNLDVSMIKYCDIELYNLRKKCEAIIEVRRDELITKPLYTISTNVMCKETIEGGENFIPIEISIHAYSIAKGGLGSYHTLIDAGEIPRNHINKTRDHAANHKITIPGLDAQMKYPNEARSDYKKIYKEILDYTQEGERVVLTNEARDIAQIRGSIDWLHKKALAQGNVRYPGVNSWTILPLTDFVTTMHNCICLDIKQQPTFALNYYIKHLLAYSGSMDYNEAIMCDYHRRGDNTTKWCAKSCAIRLISSIEEKVLEEIFKLHNFREKLKSQPELLSLPSSQPVSQLTGPPAPGTEDICMELGPSDEQAPLAITGPPQSDNELIATINS